MFATLNPSVKRGCISLIALPITPKCVSALLNSPFSVKALTTLMAVSAVMDPGMVNLFTN
ncbi:ORF957 [White spot syndrome virus]|uniref:ORF957 n=1 Tax=White spot syndrome virus TaxID=342409 RepID=A0A2D3I748_9VIRU|nr:ORF957 [White spot syndrome virus]